RGGQAADAAVGRGDVGGGEANRRLREGEGHNRAVVAVAERGIGRSEGRRVVQDGDGDGIRARAAGVADRVGVARRGDGNRALAVDAVIGCEGCGGVQRVCRGGQAADAAVGRGDVGGGEANRRLREGEGHNRAVVAVAERGIG